MAILGGRREGQIPCEIRRGPQPPRILNSTVSADNRTVTAPASASGLRRPCRAQLQLNRPFPAFSGPVGIFAGISDSFGVVVVFCAWRGEGLPAGSSPASRRRRTLKFQFPVLHSITTNHDTKENLVPIVDVRIISGCCCPQQLAGSAALPA